jgi:hypothetical protein
MTERFRLIQDGQPVAWVEGNNAVAEILHYAAVYAQDGPVIIQKKVSNGWKEWRGEAHDPAPVPTR